MFCQVKSTNVAGHLTSRGRSQPTGNGLPELGSSNRRTAKNTTPPRMSIEQRVAKAKFDEWDRSVKADQSLCASIVKRVRQVGRPKPPEGPLVYVTDLQMHTGIVLQDRFVPKHRQLETGRLLLDEHDGGRRWLYYETPPFKCELVPKGTLMQYDACGGVQQLAKRFKPTLDQLDSGKYWLDCNEGVHQWYVFPDDPLGPS